jgi:hypothetical protein
MSLPGKILLKKRGTDKAGMDFAIYLATSGVLLETEK